ncbi:BamA/OMP85 family outer membrane protein [Horticoccus sp. 23ND18S-11]|uniref:BamA/OMP85 family outer membrane protein n=1 Tax=Horticoccus sp. 23ND18S-11 TaxID=3391832 RepID=UPI0039C8DED0
MSLLLLAAVPVMPAAPAPTVKLAVDGAGWWRDRELRVALNRLLGTDQLQVIDANAIEDAAVILASTLGEAGYQRPGIEIVMTLDDGAEKRAVFDPTFENPLPRPLRARDVAFKLTPGPRYYVADVEFTGLTALAPAKARSLFRFESALFGSARTNPFSPSRVARAADALTGELRQRGYAESDVRVENQADDQTGRVVVRVTVREGVRWVVRDVQFQRDETLEVELPAAAQWLGQPWSMTLQEDLREAVRRAYYVKGFPDLGVHVEAEADPAQDGVKGATVVATIVPGPRVTVGRIRLEGNAHTKESVLRRRVRLEPGDALDLVALEQARYRISRLGVFEAVDLRTEPADGPVRDPVFKLRESPRYETNLLMGYGSYEQARAGVEHRQLNFFGLAHQGRIALVQSMKSSSGDMTYTVPELFGESLDGTARLFGLQRREIAFLRQEFGLNLSLKRPVRAIAGEATAGYTFQALRNRRNALATRDTDDRQFNVASVNVGLSGDRRDNPLRPRRGYHWSAQVESADPRLGGQSTYQRYEVAGAYHTGWGGGRWFHVALSHGVITTFGSDGSTLPVNKRFYPGGDSTIRGYQRGEAAPRGADGLFVGAKSYLLGNLELEQAVTPNWSAVAFVDALGSTESLKDYPFAEKLYSAGLGVRYQTLIGPLRLEYGRNINPRPADPPGTWHFSIGFPF